MDETSQGSVPTPDSSNFSCGIDFDINALIASCQGPSSGNDSTAVPVISDVELHGRLVRILTESELQTAAAVSAEGRHTLSERITDIAQHISNRLGSEIIHVRAVKELWSPQLTKPIPYVVPLLQFQSTEILTQSQSCLIVGQPGDGKSTVFFRATLGCKIARDPSTYDSFGFTLNCPGTIYLFDTEMSHWELWRLMEQTAKAAGWDLGKDLPEEKVKIISLRSESIKDRISTVHEYIAKPGTGLVGVDNIADLLNDVNSSEETSALMNDLLADIDRTIVGLIMTLHTNPRSKQNIAGKARGHIGSEIMRRANSVILIEEKENLKRITTDFEYGKVRAGHKHNEVFMEWSEKDRMFRTVGQSLLNYKTHEKAKEKIVSINEAIRVQKEWKTIDLLAMFSDKFKIKRSEAYQIIRDLTGDCLIKTERGGYEVIPMNYDIKESDGQSLLK